MEKNKEKAKISEYLYSLRKSNSKTLREWCLANNFDSTLWSHLENGLWKIVSPSGKPYTVEELGVWGEIAFKQGYKECREDFAVATGMAKDSEFSEIVDKMTSKLKDEKGLEKEELEKIILAECEKYVPVADQTFLKDLIVAKVLPILNKTREEAYDEGFEDGLQEANEDEQYIKYRK